MATEDAAIGILNVMDEEGASGKKDFDSRVRDNLDLFRGKQWKMKRSTRSNTGHQRQSAVHPGSQWLPSRKGLQPGDYR